MVLIAPENPDDTNLVVEVDPKSGKVIRELDVEKNNRLYLAEVIPQQEGIQYCITLSIIFSDKIYRSNKSIV